MRNKRGARGFQEGRFHDERCGSARSESARCRGQAGDPRVPSDRSTSKNLLLLVDSKADKVIDVVKYGRRDKNQTIEPVENAAMPRNEF